MWLHTDLSFHSQQNLLQSRQFYFDLLYLFLYFVCGLFFKLKWYPHNLIMMKYAVQWHSIHAKLAHPSSLSSVQSLSRVRLFATPWIAARQASLSTTISRSSLKLTSIESVMPSSHLILCHPLLFLPPVPPSIRVFFNESSLRMRWPKYWSFSFSIIPSKEHPELISFRVDWLDLLAVQDIFIIMKGNPVSIRQSLPSLWWILIWFLPLCCCYAKLLQSCPTLCNPIDGRPSGSPIPGILQARTLEWVAISFSNAWKWKVKVKSLSCARLLATPWTAAYQAPPSVGFSRQEYWSGVPLPSPDLPL